MATISRTPSKTWKAVVRKRGWPVTIKTFRTKKDATDWARRAEDEMVRGVYINRSDSERTTLQQALKRYLREVSSTKKPSTEAKEHCKSKHLIDKLGDFSLAAITPDVVANYRDERLADGKSANTVRLELALLSHVFTIAIREWRVGITYNPVNNVRKPPAGAGRDRRLSPEEEKIIFREVDRHSNPMLGWIARIALHTGMRLNEIKTLRRSQVNLDKRVVHLTETKNGTSRTVPLIRAAVAVFEEAIDNPIRPIDTDLIFFGEYSRRSGKRGPYDFKVSWHHAMHRTEIKDFRFHDLRHEAVSRLVEAGLGDQEVAAISGHKSMQMLRRYTHLRAEDLVERLDKLFS